MFALCIHVTVIILKQLTRMRMLRVSKRCDSDPRKRVKNIFFLLTNSTRVPTTRLKSKKNYHKLLLGQIQSTCANHRNADKARTTLCGGTVVSWLAVRSIPVRMLEWTKSGEASRRGASAHCRHSP